jgi:16S rRNA (cytosine967-C5)-methyltransferase
MIASARAIAFHILMKVGKGSHSDELLRSHKVDALPAQDRALATTLVLGTLRWQLKLDARIRPLLSRPDAKLPPPVETALRLGAYQLLHLDRVPAYAAIGESVELAKRAGEAHASRMVNAVLRKLAKLQRECENPELERAAEIAGAYAHPVWLVERWVSFYGLEASRAICSFDQEPAAVSIRLRDSTAEPDLMDEGIQLGAGDFLTAARRVVSGDIVHSKVFKQSRVRIQDEGSQLVAELAGSGSRILDTCAAPGGKTAILAERNPEANITAWDISKRRLETMRQTLEPFGDRVCLELKDATAVKLQPDYDLILCDVPCTGTGTINRNPEIRFRVNENDIARQHARQVKILSAALAGLATDGRLIYSTCSLEPEENEAVVAECLSANPGFTTRPLNDEIETLVTRGIITSEGTERLNASALTSGFLRTIPGIHNSDGFFAALITRN